MKIIAERVVLAQRCTDLAKTLRNDQMTRLEKIALLAAVGFLIGHSAARADTPIYRIDGHNIVSLDHIFLDYGDCRPGGEISGTVVDREFAKMGIVPSAFVLESPSGDRTLINVPENNLTKMSRVDASWVVSGLQTFLKKGVAVIAGVKSCGNAPILMLDSLREKRP